jgi:hypothetical protein|uniref:Lipoprotein n=1 Tax=Desulfobacca acetoxidans TaxID=60893 RepID=A0A7C5ETK4_9BACT
MGVRKIWLTVGVVILALWVAGMVGACAPVQEAPPPAATWPSIVTSEDRVHYYVSGLRVPGTRQEIRTRKGEANLWIPLARISSLRFTGPVGEDFRPADIVMTSGETLRVEVETNQILEGMTEAGYWNMPLGKISSLQMGTE